MSAILVSGKEHNVYCGGDAGPMLSLLPERFSLILKKWSLMTPDNPALIFGNTVISYNELWARTCDAADRMSQAGVRAGDRVAIIAENGPQGIAHIFAASELGAWAVPINARSTQRELLAITEFADCRLTVFCLANSNVSEDHANCLAASVEEGAFGRLAFSGLNTEAIPEVVYGDKSQDTAVLIFTSGTTGAPKGVMVSHQHLMYMGANMAELRNFTAEDCLYNSSPVSHVIGLGTVLLTAFCAGASVEIAPVFSAEHVVHSIASGRITCITGVPTLFGRLIDYAEGAGVTLDAGRMRILGTAGAPLTLALKTRIEKAFGMGLHNSYALSECNPVARSGSPVLNNEVGKLQPGVEVLLLNAEGNDVGLNAPGEIWVRGPSRMLGYYKNEAATSTITNEAGFIATGDLGKIDDLGQMRIVGRLKDVIIRSGFNVYPAEVENVIEQVLGVALVAVLGRSSEDNEEVVAFVQPATGSVLNSEDIRRYCRENLAPYKCPSQIIISEDLPLSETGKVQKNMLSLDGLN
ncbi:MAG: AMP-binding protein [Sneathiella sp.]